MLRSAPMRCSLTRWPLVDSRKNAIQADVSTTRTRKHRTLRPLGFLEVGPAPDAEYLVKDFGLDRHFSKPVIYVFQQFVQRHLVEPTLDVLDGLPLCWAHEAENLIADLETSLGQTVHFDFARLPRCLEGSQRSDGVKDFSVAFKFLHIGLD